VNLLLVPFDIISPTASTTTTTVVSSSPCYVPGKPVAVTTTVAVFPRLAWVAKGVP
jgi:hypothetical protein